MDPEKMMEDLSKELNHALSAMSKAKSVEDKVAYSQIVKNLSESLGVFFDFASNMMDLDFDEDEDY